MKSPVKHELRHISENGILHIHRRANLNNKKIYLSDVEVLLSSIIALTKTKNFYFSCNF
jgi:hypothetical protein